MMPKKIVFITATRADYGKLKSLMSLVEKSANFDLHLFVTGMHLIERYGFTCSEVQKDGYQSLHKFINQTPHDSMSTALAKTIAGFSDFVSEIQPDLIVVHGDRLEALSGAIVGSFNNILTAHVEGGEVSGTIDESIRHSISKLAHIHFVANGEAKTRLCQLGEPDDRIYVIGSPDIDLMNSNNLPSIADVKMRYKIDFSSYGIMIVHPVTTETEFLETHISELIEAVKLSNRNYVVIYPNNDPGNDIIIREYKASLSSEKFRVFPSMRFEYFLSLLKNANFIIGNSSAGIREAPHYGIPTIDIGSRQRNRGRSTTIIHSPFERSSILKSLDAIDDIPSVKGSSFGTGNSAELFMETLNDQAFWSSDMQKIFVDRPPSP